MYLLLVSLFIAPFFDNLTVSLRLRLWPAIAAAMQKRTSTLWLEHCLLNANQPTARNPRVRHQKILPARTLRLDAVSISSHFADLKRLRQDAGRSVF